MLVQAKWDDAQMRAVVAALKPKAFRRAVKKAGATALRDMRSETSKRVRERKAIKARYVRRSMRLFYPKGNRVNGMNWALRMNDDPMPLSRFSHRQVKRGVSVMVNRGERSIVKSAFKATMRSGHKGVYVREPGAKRLPIRELFGSRPVDAMLHRGEADAVLERGKRSFGKTWERVLPLELEKAK